MLKRLSFQINVPCIFIRLSFGGIMAIEVSNYFKPDKVILIFSVKDEKEIPFYFKWFKKIKLYKLINDKLLIHSNNVLTYMFGILCKESKKLL